MSEPCLMVVGGQGIGLAMDLWLRDIASVDHRAPLAFLVQDALIMKRVRITAHYTGEPHARNHSRVLSLRFASLQVIKDARPCRSGA